jgi:hypothetical protein
MNQIRNNPQAANLLRSIFSNDHERGKVSIETEKYVRKAFTIEAVQVTPENFAQVAEWCDGVITTDVTTPERRQFIKVRVHHPLSERQTKAYVNDFVLFAGKGFKVYTPKAFAHTFEPVFRADTKPEQSIGSVVTTEEIIPGITATRTEEVYTHPAFPELAEGTPDEWAPPGTDEFSSAYPGQTADVAGASREDLVAKVNESIDVIENARLVDATLSAKGLGSVEVTHPTVEEVIPASAKEDVYVTDAEFATLGEANLLDESKNYVVLSEAEKLAMDVANQKES